MTDDGQNMTARRGQGDRRGEPGLDSRDRTAGKGQPGEESRDRTAGTGQLRQDSRNRTPGETVRAAQETEDRTARTL